MKRLVLVTASLLALSAGLPAVAADNLPARAYTKSLGMAAYDWSGFYIGLNGGGGTSRTCWDLVGSTTEGCHDTTGGTFGGQIGYRWQTGPFVLGLEAQGNWANLSGDNVSLLFPGVRNHTAIDSFALFTGQVGYSWNNALLYVKGGAAVVSDSYRILGNATGALLGSTDETRGGGALGVGFEYGFVPNWSVAVEYNHVFLGSGTNNFASPAGPFSDNIRQNLDLFTARVNYRFGGPGVLR